LVTDENNIRVAEVASGRSCAGCHKAGCQAKAHRFPVDTSLSEGPVGVDINALDFGLLLANSLGLPLMGLLLGAGLARFWGVQEGLQLGLAIVGLGVGIVSCRAYSQSLIRIRRKEEVSCSS
jgi:positive regulator of sigma E activity